MAEKKARQSKLNWTGLALAVAGALQAVGWTEFLGNEVAGVITGALGVAVIVLRTWFTDKAIAK
jgi:hypothetical protein